MTSFDADLESRDRQGLLFPQVLLDGHSQADLDAAIGNPDGGSEVFYWDRTDSTIHQVTSTPLLSPLFGAPVISADGSRIAFESTADLDPSVGNSTGLAQCSCMTS